MRLTDYLTNVAQNYDRDDDLSTPTQVMLRAAQIHLSDHVPQGIRIRGSGGQGVPTFTPWVAFLDPSETTSVQEGLYVVYIFSADLTTVTLTLNQGVTRLSEELGNSAALIRLADTALKIRNALPVEDLRGSDVEMALGGGGWRQRAYSAGSIAAKEYSTSAPPSEGVLKQDLDNYLALYRQAISIKALSSVAGDPISEVKSAVGGQGFSSSSAQRKAIEMAAMNRAESYYCSLGWNVEDVSSNHPYDLRCIARDGVELHVEVKGTTGDGSSVLLTPGEVKHAREYPRSDLFILYGLAVDDDSGNVRVSGGTVKVQSPWEIDDGTLIPIGYEYSPNQS